MSKGLPWDPTSLVMILDAGRTALEERKALELLRGQIYVPGLGMIPVIVTAVEAHAILSKSADRLEGYEKQKAQTRREMIEAEKKKRSRKENG